MKIIFLSLLFILVFLIPSQAEDKDVQKRIENGERIQKEVLKLLPNNNPLVRGQLTDVPVVSFFVPRTIWKNLSREEQIDYTFYAQSSIYTIRENPEEYVWIPKTAPLYSKFVKKTKNLCSDCWSIILGDVIVKNGEKTITADEVVVQGDTPWNDDEPCCRGVNASNFRQEVTE